MLKETGGLLGGNEAVASFGLADGTELMVV